MGTSVDVHGAEGLVPKCHKLSQISLKVFREFRVASQNLLSSKYILCTTDLSSNVKKELQKVLA